MSSAYQIASCSQAGGRFLEYFAATIHDANTRAAYLNAVADFLAFEAVARSGAPQNVMKIFLGV